MTPPSELAQVLVQIDDVDAVTQALIEWGRGIATESREVTLAGFTEETRWTAGFHPDGRDDRKQTRLVGPWEDEA